MESFESFIERKVVRKVSPDKQRAKKLIIDGKNRLRDVQLLDIEKMPKFVFENVYDAIRDFLDAILLNEGYKSYSHEASIAYLLDKGIDVYIINKLDKFRYKRDDSRYYGEEISVEEAKSIKAFYLEFKHKINKILEEIEDG